MIHGVGCYSGSPTPLIYSTPIPPLSEPHFNEPNPPEGLQDSSFLYLGRFYAKQVFEVLSRMRDQGGNAVHLPLYFLLT